MNPLLKPLLIYLAGISIISVFITVYDKKASAKRRVSRVPEKLLLLLGFIGGASAMYITMKLIRHKTGKAKFMLNLPWMMILHLITLAAIFR